jgi:putative tricarboxylic transport membrane protein
MQSFGSIFRPDVIGAIFLGAFSGVLLGALPGLTATMAVALLVPMSFGMPINVSFGLLLGIFCGAMYGGSISAILIRTPGTPGAAATVMDGHPLCLKGEADRALSMALYASFFGGIISAVIMTLLSPYLSRIALKFGPTEYFALAVFGLSIIISVSGKSVIKGLIAGVFGLLLCTIGSDPITGYPRFTFGAMPLYEGPPLVATLIGLFAISEVFCNVESLLSGEKANHRIKRVWPSKADIKTCTPVAATGGLVGTFIGILPGVGGDIGAFFSYSIAKRFSKHPELYGTGIVEGVAATESANNGVTGGAMIPLLSLGIPGDSVTAVMLGAFIVQGLQPGPMLYKDHLPVVYMIFSSMFLANFAMLIVGLVGARFFARIIGIQKHTLVPVILVLSIIGAYSMRNSVFDIYLALTMGVIGYFMRKFDIPSPPVLLAIILGPMAESNMRRALRISDGSFTPFVTHPISAVLLAVAVLSIVTSLISQNRIAKREAMALAEGTEKETP